MIDRIIKFSLGNRLFILLAAVLLIVFGVYTTSRMDIDVFPDLTAPTVVVMTDAHGMAAEETERLVTFPIETAVNGATNVRRVRSTSVQGYSFVWIEFDWGTDVFRARQIVGEKMATLTESLPNGVQPVLAPQSSIMGEILFIGLQADSLSMTALHDLAEWTIKPAILATGGVSQVTVLGGEQRQYQILADPYRMKHFGVTMDELTAACTGISENSTGGVLREYGNEYTIRGMARTNDLEELGKTIIKGDKVKGKGVKINDVAEVRIAAAVPMGTASQNAHPAVIISVSKQPNINTLNVTKAIEKNLAELQKTLPEDVKLDTSVFRQADFIDTSVNNVSRALIEGAVFVIIVLFLFLGSFRTTIISVIAIPLSLLGTMIVLHFLHININTMTLGGMCIAIGSLVDDAIIDVENVYKRLKQSILKGKEVKGEREKVQDSAASLLPFTLHPSPFTLHPSPLTPHPSPSTSSIIFEASREIRASIINATLIIIAAFLPLFFLSGMEGRMLQPLGIAYIISLFMSLIVAMTLTPLLCKLLLSNEKYLSKQKKESWLAGRLNRWYEKALQKALNHKKSILIPAIVLFFISLGLFFTMGSAFLPEFNEGALTISAVCKPGVSLQETDKTGNLLERELLTIPEVKSTARRTGRGDLDEHSQSSNSFETEVKFILDKRSHEAFMADVREKLASVPGIATTVGQPIGHRIDHILSGTRANIAIKIFGNDLNRLFSMGNQVKNLISDIQGLADVSVEQQTVTPEIQIRAKRLMLARHGISIDEFNHFVKLAFAGEKQAEIFEGQRNYDLILKLKPEYATTIDGLKSALIDTGNGGKAPLEEVADVVSTVGPNSISRENVQRKIVVSVNTAGRDVGSAVKEIQEKLQTSLNLPEGYRIEYGGQFESAKNATRTLVLTSLIAIGIIFMLLYQEFKKIKLAGIILLNLPLALIGGVFAVFFSSNVISIPAIIGFITLFGIATRNGILLVSNYERLRGKRSVAKGMGYRVKEENEHLPVYPLPCTQIIISGSVDRLNAILMTALTAGLALLPLVWNGDKPGNEIQSPMAVVILGGLITSTLLNLFIVPIVYEIMYKKVES
ncbi:MAG: efflux RND transporter permease subunit [Dysgonamonadaceae bacterium]|jgi:Cu/Ag efflux pump CusA|nr:efflux RND transporter permease subunit [Dysgonamonadaceae bacterium]